jgi:hypothetical protein
VRAGLYVVLISLCLSAFPQASDQTSNHAKEWAERQAHYTDPHIVRSASVLEISVNSPRPLDDITEALLRRHSWVINYEDPHYAKADLVDSTAPSWLQEHPNGIHVYAVAGRAFSVKLPIDGKFPDDPLQILPPLVNAYNLSGNPARFELRVIDTRTFDVAPIATADGPQKPLLDTRMNFDTNNSDAADADFKSFCEALTRESGEAVEFLRPYPTGTAYFPDATITIHAQNRPAREILRQMLTQVTSTMSWRLLFDPDEKRFLLIFR